ncbi:MAG: hypothetical protein V4713_14060 [Pseudomonadota bacterium]
MENLLQLPNGNLIARSSIKGVVKFPNKGVALRNEFNKFLDFIREPDAAAQDLIVKVLLSVLSAGREWTQPNWADEMDYALKTAKTPE